VWVTNNHCEYTYDCIDVRHPLQFSTIKGNYGQLLESGFLIVFDDGGSSGSRYPGDYMGTTVEDNTTSPSGNNHIYKIGSGNTYGLYIGRNFAQGTGSTPVQVTGSYTVSASGCNITSGAIGNSCNNTVTLNQPFADATYSAVCTGANGSGVWTVGNASSISATSFVVPSIAMSTSATGGGMINCQVTHN
jgi:hypothetical protein